MDLVLPGILGLLVLGFFLSIVDVAFYYLRKSAIHHPGEERWKAEFLRPFIDDPMSLLLPVRMGIQAALLGMAVLITQYYIMLGLRVWKLGPVGLAFLTMLPLFVFFREAIPNMIARRDPKRVLLALLPVVRLYAKVVMPLTRPLSRLVRAVVEREALSEDEERVSEEEIQAFIESGEEEGILEGDEGRMVQSIVDLGDTAVREIMTPRPEIVAVRHDATLAELTRTFVDEKYSRIPIFEESLDHIKGVVHALDLIAYSDHEVDAPITSLIRPVQFVPETKKVAEQLREFQRGKSTLAMVVDEYGGTSGLVTVEDVLEEIVGEIHDEFDEVSEEIVREADGAYLVSGRTDIDRIREALELDVNGKGFETVSGLVLQAIGRVPQSGEVIDYEGLRIEVVDAEGHRINKVRFRLPRNRTA